MSRAYNVVVLPGDGVGPEVTGEAVRILQGAAEAFDFSMDFAFHLVGGEALDATGDPLPAATRAACTDTDAVLLGAVGGPKWDHETGPRRCEAGLLSLRKLLDAYANLRPISVPDALGRLSPVATSAGADMVIVRELTGGIYFGEPRGNANGTAINTMRYDREEIIRIARIAFRLAEARNGSVTSVDKSNVLEVSRLWRDTVHALHSEEFDQIELADLYVDNAAMQMVLDPRRFDVVVTANLFGDILSDLAATLPGSLGVLPSASVGGSAGLFEPVHGSAPDIAGKGIANPMGAILSAAMMLDHLGEASAAHQVRSGVTEAINRGVLTRDLGGSASTREVASVVLQRMAAMHVNPSAI